MVGSSGSSNIHFLEAAVEISPGERLVRVAASDAGRAHCVAGQQLEQLCPRGTSFVVWFGSTTDCSSLSLLSDFQFFSLSIDKKNFLFFPQEIS